MPIQCVQAMAPFPFPYRLMADCPLVKSTGVELGLSIKTHRSNRQPCFVLYCFLHLEQKTRERALDRQAGETSDRAAAGDGDAAARGSLGLHGYSWRLSQQAEIECTPARPPDH